MPELRKDPIIGRWVIISTERGKRPSDFSVAKDEPSNTPCPFCYGHEGETPPEILAYRPDGSPANGPGWWVRVVPNKFPALRIEGELNRVGEGVFDLMNGIGAHEVIVESPTHDLHMGDFTPQVMENVLCAYRDRVVDLKRDPRLRYILIFKNHGSAAGATLEHPHSQLIALPIVPLAVIEELNGAREYYQYKERCIFCDIIRQESKEAKRVVINDEDFLVVSPFAARFPFETWILPKRHEAAFEDVSHAQFQSLARLLPLTLKRLNRLLDTPPFNFVLHSLPLTEKNHNPYYHWHLEIMPTLTKVAGFEWGTRFYINPVLPEDAASLLRSIS